MGDAVTKKRVASIEPVPEGHVLGWDGRPVKYRPVRLMTDGLHWRVEVLECVRNWPRFWEHVNRWGTIVITYPVTETLSEDKAREVFVETLEQEKARARGFRTVAEG